MFNAYVLSAINLEGGGSVIIILQWEHMLLSVSVHGKQIVMP
uniref:Uncharacterized protein n=1 Tax=viral metagenome TaxID=1070528 RepID=A0A6C0EH25_9ZZZZ